jgi:hypothetical protein
VNPFLGKENKKTSLKDPLDVLIEPITMSTSKKIKKTLNELIQDIWANLSFQTSMRNVQALINVIHTSVGQV